MDLIFDSALSHGLIGLSTGEQKLVERDGLAAELAKYGKDFDRIIVGVGPGSYTGVRVGMALATGLHLATHKPLLGVCSLCAYVPDEDGPFSSVVSAGAGGFYILPGVKTGDDIEWGEPQQVAEVPDGLLVGPDYGTAPSVLAFARAPHQKQPRAIYLRGGVRNARPAGGPGADSGTSRG